MVHAQRETTKTKSNSQLKWRTKALKLSLQTWQAFAKSQILYVTYSVTGESLRLKIGKEKVQNKKHKTASWDEAMLFSSVKKNFSTSSEDNGKNLLATIGQVDLGSKSLVAFGPSIPHKNEQNRKSGDWIFFFFFYVWQLNRGKSHIVKCEIVINAQFCEKCLAPI